MKKLFTSKVVNVLLVAAIILGSTAVLGFTMAAAQNAADKEIVVSSNKAQEQYAIAVPSIAPGDLDAPRSQDISEETALDIVVKEIDSVLGTDVISFVQSNDYFAAFYGNGGADPTETFWEVNIFDGFYRYECKLNAVTGKIISLLFLDTSKPITTPKEIFRPLPEDNSYNEAATKAMLIVDSEASIINVRFHLFTNAGVKDVLWMAVSLEDGSDYLIGLTKDEKELVGYSYFDYRLGESYQ